MSDGLPLENPKLCTRLLGHSESIAYACCKPACHPSDYGMHWHFYGLIAPNYYISNNVVKKLTYNIYTCISISVSQTCVYHNFKRFPHNWPFNVGNPLVIGKCPLHRASKVELNAVFFVVSLNKLLFKQSSCGWFEMPWCKWVIKFNSCSQTLGSI